MKTKSIYIALLGATFAFSSCEKDDLCDGTNNQTPRLHIGLFDQANVENKKSAEYLRAYISGDEKFLELNNSSEIYLPLYPDTNETQWVIELYDVDGEEVNLIGVETFTYQYTPQVEYINKACGFKTIFNGFSFIKESSALPWINSALLTTNSLTNEQDIHLQIFY